LSQILEEGKCQYVKDSDVNQSLSGADSRQKASSATLPERPPLPSLLLPPLPSYPSPSPLQSEVGPLKSS